MMIEDLKNKYDLVNIDIFESECFSARALSGKYRMDFIFRLYYLERTKRFREFSVYRNATFSEYITNKFNLRYGTYNKERFAFIAFPEETIKWGAGLINKIKEICGADKVRTVIEQMNATPNLTHAKIDKLIKVYAKIPFKQKVPKIPRKILEDENAKRIQTIAEYINIIAKKDEQIAKLLKTIFALKFENKALKIENGALKNELKYFNNVKAMTNTLNQSTKRQGSTKKPTLGKVT